MRGTLTASLVCLMAFGASADGIKNPLKDAGSWVDLQGDLVGDVALSSADGVFTIEAPYRAHDAATVPIHIQKATPDGPRIESAMVVVDENPAPMAADITFGQSMAPLDFELRVRVDQYSNVRVISQADGGSYMAGRFVKASGGCSAPATKDAAIALANMGKMRLKHFGDSPAMSGARREAQIMIRHPNYSGLQRDQITQLFIGAHFINSLEVYQGDDMLFTLEGGISVSENPVFRFHYIDNGAAAIRIRAEDTEGNVFEQEIAKTAAS